MDFLVRLAVYALLEKEPCTPSGLEKALLELGLEVNSTDLSYYIQRQHLEVNALILVTGDGAALMNSQPQASKCTPSCRRSEVRFKANLRRCS